LAGCNVQAATAFYSISASTLATVSDVSLVSVLRLHQTCIENMTLIADVDTIIS